MGEGWRSKDLGGCLITELATQDNTNRKGQVPAQTPRRTYIVTCLAYYPKIKITGSQSTNLA